MPEGPEVAYTAARLSEVILGSDYQYINVVSGSYKNKKDEQHDSFRSGVAKLNRIAKKSGSRLQFSRVSCKGKYLYFELHLLLENRESGKWESKGFMYIGTHFMMTGRWTLEPAKHTRVKLAFTEGHDSNANIKFLYYDDLRDFGELSILTTKALQEKLAELGPDILAPSTSFTVFKDSLNQAGRSMIGSAIKEQKFISGIGNYMRADILYLAKIAPKRKVASLSDNEWHNLYTAARKVAKDSLNSNSAASYNPESGNYKFVIYGAETDSHGNPVEKIKMGGQTLFWVPKIQK